jgi:hypothetical protein
MSLLKKLSFTELIAFSEAVAKESCAMNAVGLPWDMRRRVVDFFACRRGQLGSNQNAMLHCGRWFRPA